MTEYYKVVDPRPLAQAAPYTFFLPAPKLLRAIGKDDAVQASVQAIPRSRLYQAERVWIKIHTATPQHLSGTLLSTPCDIPHLPQGSAIQLPRSHVIDVVFNNPQKRSDLHVPERQYWERCLVQKSILRGEKKVGYLYREEPDLTQPGDTDPDSGWRILACKNDCSETGQSEAGFAYVALGVVLNQDDSFLPLIDEPAGVEFARDIESGVFLKKI